MRCEFYVFICVLKSKELNERNYFNEFFLVRIFKVQICFKLKNCVNGFINKY